MENIKAIENMLRIGIVTVADNAKKKAKVWYDGLGIASGWLYVLQREAAEVIIAADGGHSHPHGVSTEPDHSHRQEYSTEPAGAHAHTAEGEDHEHETSEEPDHAHVINATSEAAGEHDHIVVDMPEPNHLHRGSWVSGWMPRVSDRVVVACIPVPDGDGFILGSLP